jgi:S-formylglutathione hydrolase FrmB
VYLPASYSTPEARTRRYPVVYFLHGWPGGDGNWPGSGRAITTLDSLIATRRIPELIGVMPNGNGIGIMGRSAYIDSWDGRSRMAEFIVKELPAWVDRTLRTRPEASMRGLLGLSDGGFGAFNLAFHHPGVFGAAASHSGHFRLVDDVSIRHVLGEGATAERIIANNDAFAYVTRAAPQLRHMSIYFDCGLQDEDLAANRALDRKLTSLGIPHTYREFPGNHGWGYWKSHLHESLVAITAQMR